MAGKIYLGSIWIGYSDYEEIDYSKEYLTFNVLTPGTITWTLSNANGIAKTISYKKNDGSWTSITSSTSGASINVSANDVVKFKGSNSQYATSNTYYNYFGGTATFDIYGNIMSMIGGDNFDSLNTLSSTYTFTSLFADSNTVNADNLVLPATTLTDYCYYGLLQRCLNLVSAKFDLPAITLAVRCYALLFRGSTNLVQGGPNTLSATTLARYCYNQMYDGCSSLAVAPEFAQVTITARPAATAMFRNCTSLTTAPNYNNLVQYASSATTTDNTVVASYMFYGCTSLVNIYPVNFWLNPQYFFYGCTSITEATVDIKNIPPGGYTSGSGIMWFSNNLKQTFYGCSSLNKVNINHQIYLSNAVPDTLCEDWLYGVSNTGVINANDGTGLTVQLSIDSASGVPIGWTINTDIDLYFNIKTSGTITWNLSSASATPKTIKYKKFGSDTWTSITSSTSGVSINVSQNDQVHFRGDNSWYCGDTTGKYSYFGGTATFDVGGNIMSLINSSNFVELMSLTDSYTFYGLFRQSNVLSARYLFLPATTLSQGCYGNMFYGCTSLTYAPRLQSRTLAQSCYSSMFYGCTSLTTAPDLLATTPATYCYNYMFEGCSSLNYVKCMLTTLNGTTYWLNNVSSTGTFIMNPDLDWIYFGASGIPSGWTVSGNWIYLSASYSSGGGSTKGKVTPEPGPLPPEPGGTVWAIGAIGSDWDVSDLTNNPPVLYMSYTGVSSREIPTWTISGTDLLVTHSYGTNTLSPASAPTTIS